MLARLQHGNALLEALVSMPRLLVFEEIVCSAVCDRSGLDGPRRITRQVDA
jgi:hypothetical protein